MLCITKYMDISRIKPSGDYSPNGGGANRSEQIVAWF